MRDPLDDPEREAWRLSMRAWILDSMRYRPVHRDPDPQDGAVAKWIIRHPILFQTLLWTTLGIIARIASAYLYPGNRNAPLYLTMVLFAICFATGILLEVRDDRSCLSDLRWRTERSTTAVLLLGGLLWSWHSLGS